MRKLKYYIAIPAILPIINKKLNLRHNLQNHGCRNHSMTMHFLIRLTVTKTNRDF